MIKGAILIGAGLMFFVIACLIQGSFGDSMFVMAMALLAIGGAEIGQADYDRKFYEEEEEDE